MAAITRSSSMSLSSPTRLGSIATFFTENLHVITTFTRPAPDWPSTSIFASSSWAFFMFSCICCACFIKAPSPPFIMSSPLVAVGFAHRILGRANGSRDHFRAEIAHELAHERIFLDRFGGARLALGFLFRSRGGEAAARGGSHAHREPQARAEMRRELGLQLFQVGLVRIHLLRVGDHELEMVVLERSEFRVTRRHPCHAGELQAIDQAG